MGIVDEDIGRVRDATDIVAVITQYTTLKRSGQQWMGPCPFHADKSPSFSVNASEGVYYCFGCQVRGDAITFVREKENLDFVGAVEWLASRAGITLRYTDKDEGEGRRRHGRLLDLVDRAAEWYHQRLRTSPDAAAARAYLRGRGFDSAEVDHYRLGWAPDGWDLLTRALGAPAAELEAAGLGFTNKANRQQDFFRSRVLFPISDDRGRVIAFGGRKLPGADGAKYQNSRDNELYNKSKALYGLNWAKADVVTSGEVVVCEGYTDVIGFARAGIPRAIATCGTSLTEDHVKMLKRFTNRLVLAYDGDKAGQAAADRVYAWEQTYDIEVAVVALPPGSDPDELARTEPQTLHDAVESAAPYLAFRVDRVISSADLRSVEGRARAAESALEVVAEHPDDLVRDQYVMQLADTCRIDAARLRTRLEQVRANPPAPSAEQAAAPKRRRERRSGDAHEWEGPAPWDSEPPPSEYDTRGAGPARSEEPVRDGPETEALGLAIHRPEVIAAHLDESLFLHPVVRSAYRALCAASSVAEAVEQATPPAAASLLARLSVEPSHAESLDVMSRLATEVGRTVLADLESQARVAADPNEYSASIAWLALRLQELRGSKIEVEIVTQLLAWLADRQRANDTEVTQSVHLAKSAGERGPEPEGEG